MDILTGGGPGIMTAANIGLKEGAEARLKKKKKNGAKNIGNLVTLPFEERPNNYLDVRAKHSTFGTRLNEFADRSNSIVTWDGGAGSDLEIGFFYQLMQVGYLEADFPIILKRDLWEDIQNMKIKKMLYERIQKEQKPLISPQDTELVQYVDHPDDAIQQVLDHYGRWKQNVWRKLDGQSQEAIINS